MKKHHRALLFQNQMEQIIIHYGDEDVKRKIEFVKNFLKENFQIDEFDNSYIEIERVHSKTYMWLLLSLIIEYETSQKMKTPDRMGIQKKYRSLVVEDIYPMGELTSAEVVFTEHCLEDLNVDLENEAKTKFILSTKQLLCLITGIMREHTIFFGKG
jgi:hypothetical protein